MKPFIKLSALVAGILFCGTFSLMAEEELVWTDMSAFPLYGKVVSDSDELYSRFPQAVIAQLPERKAPERIQDLAKCSAGMYIRFRSDAPVLKASWEVAFFDLWPFGHMTDANKRGLDIYALEDGKWVFMGVARPKNAKVNTVKLTVNPERKMREYMLYLSNYDQVKWLKLGHPAGTKLELPSADTPKSGRPVLLYGTSITQGGCASRPGLGYSNIMSRLLDRTVINVGLSGNGCFDLPVAEYMARCEQPGCIVIDNMANCRVQTVEQWGEQFIGILRKAFPEVPIVLVSKPSPSTQYYNKPSYERNKALNASFRTLYDKLRNAGDWNIHFLDLAAEMDGCEYTVDGVHYTDPGMQQLAEGIAREVKKRMAEADVFDIINLDYPGLEAVKACVADENWEGAKKSLLDYYRNRAEILLPGLDLKSRIISQDEQEIADDAMKHIFRVHGKPYLDYGKDINWEYWPVKDIEKRVFLHRVPMWPPMGKAYRATGDEKYVREWMFQLLDWERKNPYKPFVIDQHGTVSSGTIDVDSPNECFVWRPLDISRRLTRLCEMLALVRDAESLTPDFLARFLCIVEHNASVLSRTFSPAGNHLIHQASNIIQTGMFFPELREADGWTKAGIKILEDQINIQTTEDGCHFELDPGYQYGVVHSYNKALQMAVINGRQDLFPSSVTRRLGRVSRYLLDMSYPDGSKPCFSDAKRGKHNVGLFRDVVEYNPEDKQLLWFATHGAEGEKPSYTTVGYPATGFYTFRTGWDKDALVMPVKATERGMWHAQPDFGTFELWYAGKVLMPDAGCYTYSGDEETERWRAYFKATARHNCITLDDRNYDDPKPKVIEWKPEGTEQVLSVEHQAYEGLTHRRTVKFVGGEYFVVEDVVSGKASGTLRLRFGLGAGQAELEGGERVASGSGSVVYRDGDCGLRMTVSAPAGSRISLEKDWYSEAFLQKSERPMVVVTLDRKGGKQTFVTKIYPFKGLHN